MRISETAEDRNIILLLCKFVEVHRRMLLVSSSLTPKQCPARPTCLDRFLKCFVRWNIVEHYTIKTDITIYDLLPNSAKLTLLNRKLEYVTVETLPILKNYLSKNIFKANVFLLSFFKIPMLQKLVINDSE